jgi:hypothetical protein
LKLVLDTFFVRNAFGHFSEATTLVLEIPQIVTNEINDIESYFLVSEVSGKKTKLIKSEIFMCKNLVNNLKAERVRMETF